MIMYNMILRSVSFQYSFCIFEGIINKYLKFSIFSFKLPKSIKDSLNSFFYFRSSLSLETYYLFDHTAAEGIIPV